MVCRDLGGPATPARRGCHEHGESHGAGVLMKTPLDAEVASRRSRSPGTIVPRPRAKWPTRKRKETGRPMYLVRGKKVQRKTALIEGAKRKGGKNLTKGRHRLNPNSSVNFLARSYVRNGTYIQALSSGRYS